MYVQFLKSLIITTVFTKLWCSDGATSTFALSPLGRRCESAKLRRRKCESATAKERKCEDATAKREDAMAKVRRCEGEGAILLSLLRLRNFALSPSQLRTFAFAFFDSIQKVSVDYIEFDAGTVLAKVFRLIHDIIGTHALGHCAYYECL